MLFRISGVSADLLLFRPRAGHVALGSLRVVGARVLTIAKLTKGRLEYLETQAADELEHPALDVDAQLDAYGAYLAQGGEAIGVWWGRGASELGLTGGVIRGQLAAVSSGVNPLTDQRYARRIRSRVRDVAVVDPVTGDRRVVEQRLDPSYGFDLVFSAPKSVSVAAALGDSFVRLELLAAHEAAVDSALSLFERDGAQVRRGHAGAIVEHASGVIIARFGHELSRRVEHADGRGTIDPQLHTHCALANHALTRDGEWRALHGRVLLCEYQKTLGAVYRAQLRHEVTRRLGWTWAEARSNGLRELAGWSEEALREMSQRRIQVEDRLLATHGTTRVSAAQSRAAAVATRAAKSPAESLSELRFDWCARLAEHGLETASLDTLLAPGLALPEVVTDAYERDLFEFLTGPYGLTERDNTFSRADALRVIADALESAGPTEVVETLAESFLTLPDVVRLRGEALDDPIARYSATGLLEAERVALDLAENAPAIDDLGVPAHRVERAIQRAPIPLADEQANLIRTITTSTRAVEIVEARAGTGKTTTLGVLASAYRSVGFEVIGLAPTARAARELDSVGVLSRTIDARLLGALPHDPARRRVVLVDEAGMTATRQLAGLLRLETQAGSKIVLCGDPAQLGPVGAGGVYQELCSARPDHARLETVRRQRDPLECAALDQLRRSLAGDDPDGVAAYLSFKVKRGELELHATSDSAVDAAISWWRERVANHSTAGVVVIAHDNANRASLNAALREQAETMGLLEGDEHTFHQVDGQLALRVGDRVIARRNDSTLDIDNGTRATVVQLDATHVVLAVDAREQSISLPRSYVEDGGLEHGYAVTGHGMQGATVDAVLVVSRPTDHTREWTYTVASRARGETRQLVVCDRETREAEHQHLESTPTPELAVETMIRLEQLMRRSEAIASPLAHELRDIESAPAQSRVREERDRFL